MNNYYLLKDRLLLLAFLVFVISACEHTSTLPSPEFVPGVYLRSGFEFYRWKEGLAVMIWHDGTKNSGCESSTRHQNFIMQCISVSEDDRRLDWYLETKDGETAKFSINNQSFDLTNGNVLIIKNADQGLSVIQLCPDISNGAANAEAVIEFGLSDPTVRDFVQSQAHIKGCVSSYYISDESPTEMDLEAAQEAIIKFFSSLHAGEYQRAVDLYGGSYTVMQDQNPDIDPEDHAALFRNACLINGAQCLEIRKITFLDQPLPNEFRFFVEFLNEDELILTSEPCCADNSIDSSPQTEFIYTARRECTGKYHVLEMPVYLP